MVVHSGEGEDSGDDDKGGEKHRPFSSPLRRSPLNDG